MDIFICYRRGDSAAHAGRLADALVERFGRNSVFMDVDTIEPGVDFIEEIERAVGHCDVLIALIGPQWLAAADARGRRLDNPDDLVRLEIEAALARSIRVIPALVGGAAMPSQSELPGDLAGLARRNSIELSDRRFRSNLQDLFEALDKIAQQKHPERSVARVRGTDDVVRKSADQSLPPHAERTVRKPRPLALGTPPLKADLAPADRRDYPPIVPQLQTDSWYTQNHAFTFAIPDGWSDLASDRLLELSDSIGADVIGGVTTFGSDPYPANIAIYTGPEASEPDLLSRPEHAVAVREQATRFALGAGPFRIALGGLPALLFFLSGTAPGQLYGRDGPVPIVSGEVWTLMDDRPFCVVMSGAYDRYPSKLPAFYTILGTWTWKRGT